MAVSERAALAPMTVDLKPAVVEHESALIIVAGPSGVGKGTLCKMLFDQYGDEFGFSVSNTTRGPRPGEEDGVHYNFVSKEEFQTHVDAGEMLEYAHVHGNMYGTSKPAVQRVLQQSKSCILDIDVQGAELIAKQMHDLPYP